MLIPLLACSPTVEVAPHAAPNIVLILADDLGYGDIEWLNPDSKIATPHLNALAQAGLSFTDAHSGSSVCTPTRYGLLTGRYAWRTRLKQAVLWPYDPPLIEPERLTLPEILRDAGYRTACIGKWHLGWQWKLSTGGYAADSLGIVGYDRALRQRVEQYVDFGAPLEGGPTAHGFDYYFGDDVPNFPPYAFIENDRLLALPDRLKPDSLFGDPGKMVEGWSLEAVMPELTRKAVDYLRTQDDEQPFFLYLPLTAPHTPIVPSAEFRGSSQAGLYGDYVQQVDATVGKVLRALEEEGLAENTLLIFTSDNGSVGRDGQGGGGQVMGVRRFGHEPSYHFRGIKADIWEGGHRVPLFFRWPAHIPAGESTDQLACLTDLMATIAALLDTPLPGDAAEDSYDLAPLLTNPALPEPIRPSIVHHSIDGTFAVREGSWKLILGPGSGGWTAPNHRQAREQGLPERQLYNLAEDVGEVNNVVEQHPERTQSLLALLEQIKHSGRRQPLKE